jgi:UDPglucose 6-dehydrogenase
LLAEMVKSHLGAGGSVGILGITYKPDTDVVEEAFGLLLAQELSSASVRLAVFDPAADMARALAGCRGVRCATSAQACIAESDVVVLATPWQEFREIAAADWVSRGETRTLVDCWGVLSHLDGLAGLRYVRLGLGADSARRAEVTSGVR